MCEQMNWKSDETGVMTADVGGLEVQVERVARMFRIYVFRRNTSFDMGDGTLLACASEADMPRAIATAERLADQCQPAIEAA